MKSSRLITIGLQSFALLVGFMPLICTFADEIQQIEITGPNK
jgi:hypothetical protein